jgi:hypothetical protein
MFAKVREHGAPVQGVRLVRKREICPPPTQDADLRLGRQVGYSLGPVRPCSQGKTHQRLPEEAPAREEKNH